MKTTSCICFNSNREESICMPVLQRQDMDPKDCLIQLLTVYFSHPHIRLNLHSVARYETGKALVCIHVREVSSMHRRTEKCARSRGLCSTDLLSVPCHASPPPQASPLAARSYFCALLLSRCNYGMSEIWLHFDATCCKAQEQYALRPAAVSYIVLIFNIVKPEFPEY